MRRIASRGMVQVRGVTYRVERVEPHHYAVVRLLDDVEVGTFQTLPGLRLHPLGCDADLFMELAQAALRFARTSGMTQAVPAPVVAQSSPSSMPPGALSPFSPVSRPRVQLTVLRPQAVEPSLRHRGTRRGVRGDVSAHE